MYSPWPAYVPVAERRRKAAAEMAQLEKKGHKSSPVCIVGKAITTTPWGTAWCTNLENYSDFSNRLPRGRTYVRNGSVVDLQINAGTVAARVSGSSIYRTSVTIHPLKAAAWKTLCSDCAGGIDSLVELLQGRFDRGVMARMCRHGDGLFPSPKEITFTCSCPDDAYLCKHVAAALYGIGARFDHQPELLFTLRQVNASELVLKAGTSLSRTTTTSERTLNTDDVGALFGLEMDAAPVAPKRPAKPVAKVSTKPVAKPAIKAKKIKKSVEKGAKKKKLPVTAAKTIR